MFWVCLAFSIISLLSGSFLLGIVWERYHWNKLVDDNGEIHVKLKSTR